jgi:protein-tyrosine phosphatase
MAEGILQHKADAAKLDWQVDSAGTNGFHVGEAPHKLSQKVAKMHGIDISRQVARKFTANDFNTFDKIYAMTNDVMEEIHSIAGNKFDASKVDLLMNELHPKQNEDIPDPWYGTEAGYHTTFEMIDEATDALIEKYKN